MARFSLYPEKKSRKQLQIKLHLNCHKLLILLALIILNACGEPGKLLSNEEENNSETKNLMQHMPEAKCNNSVCHGNEIKVSKLGALISHNTGKDCLTCHSVEGAGRGIFTVAGSIYKPDGVTPYPNLKVKLFAGENRLGSPVAVLDVDGNGNFFTTKEIARAYGDGDADVGYLYPSVISENGEYKMPTAYSLSVGGCNSCHGVDVARIFAE